MEPSDPGMTMFMDWRPMEYVPKDGRPVMLYTVENDLDGKDYMVGAYWRKHLQCWACSPGSRWGVIMGRPILWAPLLVSPVEPNAAVFQSNFHHILGRRKK